VSLNPWVDGGSADNVVGEAKQTGSLRVDTTLATAPMFPKAADDARAFTG